MLARSPIKRRVRNTGPTPAVVELVLERAGFSCEVCTHMVGDRRGIDWSIHHRRPRQMGGSRLEWLNLPSNLMLVCGSGTSGCHGFIESHRADSVYAGWLVLSHTDPARTPLLVERSSKWTYLGDDGEYHDDPPEVAA